MAEPAAGPEPGAVDDREAGLLLQAFFAHSGAYPWEWLPQYADEWFGDLRSVRRVAHSTMRSYQDALRSFCAYVSDPVYDWPAECEQRFGTHPVQIVHEWSILVSFLRSP